MNCFSIHGRYFGPTYQYLHVRLSVLRGLACMHGLLHHSPHSPDAFSHPNTRKINSPKFQEPFNIRTSLRRISAGGFEAVLYHPTVAVTTTLPWAFLGLPGALSRTQNVVPLSSCRATKQLSMVLHLLIMPTSWLLLAHHESHPTQTSMLKPFAG